MLRSFQCHAFNNETLFSGGLAFANGCSVLPLPGDVQREQRRLVHLLAVDGAPANDEQRSGEVTS